MPDCNETLREMFVFLDGEIAAGVRHQIESHLGDCPDCLGAFEFHLVLKETVRRVVSSEEAPPSLMARIAACFPEQLPGQSSGPAPAT